MGARLARSRERPRHPLEDRCSRRSRARCARAYGGCRPDRGRPSHLTREPSWPHRTWLKEPTARDSSNERPRKSGHPPTSGVWACWRGMRKILITAVAGAALAITPALASKPVNKPTHPSTSQKGKTNTKAQAKGRCKVHTVGYNAKGTLVSQTLTQTAGA